MTTKVGLLPQHRLFCAKLRQYQYSCLHQRKFLRLVSFKGVGKTIVATDVVPTSRRTAVVNDVTIGPELLLYERKTNTTVTLLRSGFFCSTCHTAYWFWYLTDFMPLVNASPIAQLHINPLWGYTGFALAVAINAVFAVYPQRFVSKIVYRPQLHELAVFAYRVPWMYPSTFASRFPVGDQADTLMIPQRKPSDYFRLDVSSEQGKRVVATGDLTSVRGHLNVGSRWPRYSVDFQSKNDLLEPDILLEILLRPEYFRLGNPGDEDTHHDEYSSRRFRRKKRKTSTARSNNRRWG